jgi:hypothetical protein
MGKCAELWERVVDVAMFLFIGIDKFGVNVAGRGELINSHGWLYSKRTCPGSVTRQWTEC